MVYIIDHYYASNRREECVIVKNNQLSIEEMIALVGSLSTLYIEATDCRECRPRDILNVLCGPIIYSKDKKYKYLQELGFIERRLYSPVLSTVFMLGGELVVWIDIKEAMDYVIGRRLTVLANYFTMEEIKQLKNNWQETLAI